LKIWIAHWLISPTCDAGYTSFSRRPHDQHDVARLRSAITSNDLRSKRKEVSRMENRKVLLCPAGCGACPEVEFAGEQVRVGEAGNLAVLTKDEWNVLVDLIQSGELTKV